MGLKTIRVDMLAKMALCPSVMKVVLQRLRAMTLEIPVILQLETKAVLERIHARMLAKEVWLLLDQTVAPVSGVAPACRTETLFQATSAKSWVSVAMRMVAEMRRSWVKSMVTVLTRVH